MLLVYRAAGHLQAQVRDLWLKEVQDRVDREQLARDRPEILEYMFCFRGAD